MKVGTHVSIEGGIWKAPGNAKQVGAEVFQIFTRSPHGGPAIDLSPKVVEKFKQAMVKCGFDTFYIHTPYFINLASEKNNIYFGSISVVRQELIRGSTLGAKYVMTHLGSFGEATEKKGIERVIGALIKIFQDYRGKTKLLLEMSAGAGRIIGDTFEELARILDDKKLAKHKIGICFDTCHAFASGYDLRTPEEVRITLEKLRRVLGFENLKLVHANDSQGGLKSHLDRHEHIGRGKIGLAGFEALVRHKALRKLDWILETPKDTIKDEMVNIKTLKNLRK